jgi:hypothetical protein
LRITRKIAGQRNKFLAASKEAIAWYIKMKPFNLSTNRPTYEILKHITGNLQRVQEWSLLALKINHELGDSSQVIDGSKTLEEVVIESLTDHLQSDYRALFEQCSNGPCRRLLDVSSEQVDWGSLASFLLDIAHSAPQENGVPLFTAGGKGRFNAGRIVITRGAADRISEHVVNRLLGRHFSGDWGDLGEFDWVENDRSLEFGGRLMSVYNCNDQAVWIITEADRSATTVLLPNEY